MSYGTIGWKLQDMLGTSGSHVATSDLVAWAGRDRAAKVAATAATIGHGWNKLTVRELERLSEALEDHTRAYLDWLYDVSGATSDQVHTFRGILTTILSANRLLRQGIDDELVRQRLAEMLARAAHALVDSVDAASRDEIDIP